MHTTCTSNFWCRFQSIDVLSNCTELQQLTVGEDFNQPVNMLLNCTILKTEYPKSINNMIRELRDNLTVVY